LDGGGALMNQCVHGIDALLWLMGDDVASVFSYSGTQVREIEVEDTSVSVVRFKSGAYGTIVGTTSVIPAQPSRTEIHGDKGSLVLSNDGVRCWTSRLVKGVHKEQPVDLAKRFRTRKPAGKGGPGGAADPKAIGWYGHTAQVQDFCRAILNDRQPIINGPQARKPVALILAIYKSAKTGKEVVLD
ncbi:MAG: Gfo/Idh/MocA family oxidoreductase, partial [Lentisphaerae bacterium]|nr:Gfo/Idh/MocA family oxidoreductase [Lentisphaerota bacterium]